MFEVAYNREFAATLSQMLHGLLLGYRARRIKYGELADEWPIGRTPPEIERKYEEDMKAREELEVATSDNSSHDDDGDEDDTRVDPKRGASSPDPPRQLPHVLWLLTPPQSVHEPLLKPCGRKRRRNLSTDKEDASERPVPQIQVSSTTTEVAIAVGNVLSAGLREESRKRGRALDDERKNPIRTCGSSSVTRLPPAENALPSGSKEKAQKRRRTRDVVDNKEEKTIEWPLKSCVTTPRSSRRLRILRPRKAEAGRERY